MQPWKAGQSRGRRRACLCWPVTRFPPCPRPRAAASSTAAARPRSTHQRVRARARTRTSCSSSCRTCSGRTRSWRWARGTRGCTEVMASAGLPADVFCLPSVTDGQAKEGDIGGCPTGSVQGIHSVGSRQHADQSPFLPSPPHRGDRGLWAASPPSGRCQD